MNPIVYRAIRSAKHSIFDKEKGDTLNELERNQWLSQDELKNLQLNKIKKLVSYAYENVPFYRRRFDSIGLNPLDINSFEDFSDIPALTKDDIRNNLDKLVGTHIKKIDLKMGHSSGSTGVPLRFYMGANLKVILACLRYRKWYGYHPGDRFAHIWGRNIYNDRSKTNRIADKFIRNYYYVSFHEISQKELFDVANDLIKWQPSYINTYVSTGYNFAKFLRETNLARVRPKAVEVNAEKLWDFQRDFMEKVFSCPVYDMYGSNEIYNIAAECEKRQGLHIFSDLRYIEFINDNKPVKDGSLGELIITDLENYIMPLIRYQNGDVGVKLTKKCDCKRTFPLMKVEGRTIDVITTPDKRYMYSVFFEKLFYDLKGVKQFLVYQRALDRIEIYLVPLRDFNESVISRIREMLENHFGQSIQFEFKVVQEIQNEISGKYRLIRSDVPVNFLNNIT